MSEVDVQIIVPAGADETDPLDHALVTLTEAICQATGEEGGYGLGGRFGYGENFENDVFTMRRFYWGDCDCGADERGEAWHEANPHDPDCFRTVLHKRFAEYDEQSGYNALDRAMSEPGMMESVAEKTPFGTMHSTHRTAAGEISHKKWSKAYDLKNKEHARLTEALYDERGLPSSPYQWLCTCGVDERAKGYFETEGHYPVCSLMLPNFRHKKSGLEVRWYKWIGRDMETKNLEGADLQAIFSECLESLKTRCGDR